MGAAVGGVLAVDEGEEGLAVAVGVGEGEFEGGGAVAEGRIEAFVADFVEEDVDEAVLGEVFFAVADDFEAGLEAGAEAQALADVLGQEVGAGEDVGVGRELDEGAVGFLGAFAGGLALEDAALEDGLGVLAAAVGADPDARG